MGGGAIQPAAPFDVCHLLLLQDTQNPQASASRVLCETYARWHFYPAAAGREGWTRGSFAGSSQPVWILIMVSVP